MTGSRPGPTPARARAWRGRCGSRPFRRRHLRAVVRIEEDAYPRPWSATLFLSELAQRAVAALHGRRPRAARRRLRGLMIVGDEGHVTTLTVDPAWHRRGIGTVLLLDLARAAPGLGVRHLTLEVRVAQRRRPGAVPALRLRPRRGPANYYAETGEDAIVMWARDIDTADYAERLAG